MELEDAFERAGFSAPAVAFASACHDLARLALNREPDPKRAVAQFLGLAHGPQFRECVAEFLAGVAREIPSGVGDQEQDGNHPVAVAAPETHSGDGAKQRLATDRGDAPPPEPQARGGQSSNASPRLPTPAQIRAVTVAKQRSAAIMSGIMIPDHRGGSEPFDNIKIAFYGKTLERLGRAVGRNSVAFNLLKLAKARADKQAFIKRDEATSASVFSLDEMREMHKMAMVFAGSGLVSLPEELRAAVMEDAA